MKLLLFSELCEIYPENYNLWSVGLHENKSFSDKCNHFPEQVAMNGANKAQKQRVNTVQLMYYEEQMVDQIMQADHMELMLTCVDAMFGV